MKDKKIALLSILMLLPLYALADHEAFLFPLFIVIIEFIISIILISVIHMKLAWKPILMVVYIIMLYSSFSFIGNMPFDNNETEINLILTVVPPISVIIIYILFKMLSKYKKPEKK